MTKISQENLNQNTLSQPDHPTLLPTYDRKKLIPKILHIGVGGFHRAHQAFYLHQLLNLDYDCHWSICGIGLLPADKALDKHLTQQDYLYSLLTFSEENKIESRAESLEIIGSITQYIYAPENTLQSIEKIAHPDIQIISMTITEGGYLNDDITGEFQLSHPDIQSDLECCKSLNLEHLALQKIDLKRQLDPRQQLKTIFGYLYVGLKRRQLTCASRNMNMQKITLLSCDNLPHNGAVAKHSLISFCQELDFSLTEWIKKNLTFPNSMVDRITPKTNIKQAKLIHQKFGIEDLCPVTSEPYLQWIIEDNFAGERPSLEKVGVQFVKSVTPYETMKMRLLNASHSILGYVGFLAGYSYVHETMQDNRIKHLVQQFMDHSVTPYLPDVPGIDLTEYKENLINRFANPHIADDLVRICSDGSNKLPKFLFPSIENLIQAGENLELVSTVIASWLFYCKGIDSAGNTYSLNDPAESELKSAAQNPEHLTSNFLNRTEIFGETIAQSKKFRQLTAERFQQISQSGIDSIFQKK